MNIVVISLFVSALNIYIQYFALSILFVALKVKLGIYTTLRTKLNKYLCMTNNLGSFYEQVFRYVDAGCTPRGGA